jgi:hypothetical protein
MYFFTTKRLTQLVCRQSDDKKLLIFSMLKRFAPALGRLEQPLRNYAAQRYAPDLRPALSGISIAGGSNSESVS